nr:zinc knuckle CX2CX4HX4C [Tanacetum cinerariifolium]
MAELPTDRAALDEYIGVWFRSEVPDAVELRSTAVIFQDLEQLGILNVVVARIIDVAATFGVPLTTVGDLHKLINDIEAGKHDELLSGMTNDDRMETIDALDHVFDGVNISIPRKVVKKVSTRFEHTLYGYFIGKRMAVLVVEYFARNNWAKHGLKRIMMNSKGFFFFKFDSRAGLEAVLEVGAWLIRKSPIILKKWSMDTRLLKEELTRILIWVKLHDVPIQFFLKRMRLISWINSEADFVDVVTIGIPSLSGDGFTKETIRVEYE